MALSVHAAYMIFNVCRGVLFHYICCVLSMVDPAYTCTPLEAMTARIGALRDLDVRFRRLYNGKCGCWAAVMVGTCRNKDSPKQQSQSTRYLD